LLERIVLTESSGIELSGLSGTLKLSETPKKYLSWYSQLCIGPDTGRVQSFLIAIATNKYKTLEIKRFVVSMDIPYDNGRKLFP
jgi:hypothetical protein